MGAMKNETLPKVFFHFKFFFISFLFISFGAPFFREKKTKMSKMFYAANITKIAEVELGRDIPAEAGPVFDFFISTQIVRREIQSMPDRDGILFLIRAIDEIRDLCVLGNFLNAPQGKLKMIQHLGFFTVYKLLGIMAVNVALVEEACGASHADTFNRLNTVPTLEPFVVTMS